MFKDLETSKTNPKELFTGIIIFLVISVFLCAFALLGCISYGKFYFNNSDPNLANAIAEFVVFIFGLLLGLSCGFFSFIISIVGIYYCKKYYLIKKSKKLYVSFLSIFIIISVLSLIAFGFGVFILIKGK